MFFVSIAPAQVVGPGFVDYVTSAPSGTCSQGQHQQNVLGSGAIYTCQTGTWGQVAGGGSAVSSVFGRTGAVTAQTADYGLGQIGNPAAGTTFTYASNQNSNWVLQGGGFHINGGLLILDDSSTPNIVFGPTGLTLPRGQLCYATGAGMCSVFSAAGDVVLTNNGSGTRNLILGVTNGNTGEVWFEGNDGISSVIEAKLNNKGVFTLYNKFPSAGLGLPQEVAEVVKNNQTTALGPTTFFTASGAGKGRYLVLATLYCDTSSAAATATLTITYQDPSSATQTIAPAAVACTSLGASSFVSVNVPIECVTSSAISYTVSIANTPTYDLAIELYSLFSI